MSLFLKTSQYFSQFFVAFALFLGGFGHAALAEEVNWSGDSGQLIYVNTGYSSVLSLTPQASSPNGNTVRVENTTRVPGYVFGGYNYISTEASAESLNNEVSLSSGADIQDGVTGGYAGSGSGTATASGNAVFVTGAAVGRYLYGGYALGSRGAATASENTIVINGGTIGGEVRGGYATINQGAGASIADRNNISIMNGAVSGNVSGGYTRSQDGLASSSENTVSVSGGTVSGWLYGGWANSANGQATASQNKVIVSDGNLTYVFGAFAVTDSGPGEARQNSVEVTGGTITQHVVGGYALKNQAGVETSGIVMTASDNTVTVSGGTIQGSVYGGITSHAMNTATSGGVAAATGNSVVISGGVISGSVYGGSSRCLYTNPNTGQVEVWSTAIATHNSVTLSGAPVFGASTWLYGGNVLGDDTSDSYTGNTLNVLEYRGATSVAGIANFQNYNFLVPSTLATGSVYLQSGELDLGASPYLQGVAVTAGRALPDGYTVDLIRSDATINGERINENIVVPQGALLEYDGIVTTTDNALNLRLSNARATEQAGAVAGGAAASVALSVQGAHILATRGIAAALAATGGTDGFATFGIVEGGSFRYNTGSHVDVTGVSLLAGVAAKVRIGDGLLVVGPAFEAAYADFEGHIGSVKGDGYGRSYGGALLGRYRHDSGAYLDASLRAGLSFLSYDSGLRDSFGRSASYESEVPYYGLHVGPGWQWRMTEKTTLDLFAAYFWTHVEGSTETMTTGERVRFEDADSHRLRGGARISCEVTQGFEPYVGASYEYELDGDSRAGAYGHSFKTLSLKGGSGMGEAGLYWRAGSVFIDVGVQGYTGVREGIGGSLMARFEF